MQSSFASVAELIGDARLAKPLEQLARQVEIEAHNAKFIPRPADVRREIERVKRNARRFEASLKLLSGRRLLDLPSRAFGKEENSLGNARKATHDIIALCEESLIRGKRGRKRRPGRVQLLPLS